MGAGLLLAAASAAAQETRYGQVLLPDGARLHVELADTPRRQALGYMFRDGVGPEDGMLFPFPEEGVHTFWMKNVRFPLDMIWLDREGAVLHLESRVPPCEEDPCPSVGPMVQAAFVLELAAGRAEELELGPGVRLEVLMPAASGD